MADVARRGGQRSVEVTRRVVQRVEVAVEPRTGVEQLDLVREALRGVAGADLARKGFRAADREVFVDQLPHVPLQGPGLLLREGLDAVDLAVEPALAHRVADMERAPRIEVAHGLLQQKPGGALVDADAGEGGDVHEADRHRGIYFVVELLDAVVHQGGQERPGPRGDLPGDLEQGGAHRDLQLAAEVLR